MSGQSFALLIPRHPPRGDGDRERRHHKTRDVMGRDVNRVEMQSASASTIIVSCAPGENATTTLAIGNGKKCATISANRVATESETANEPNAAPR